MPRASSSKPSTRNNFEALARQNDPTLESPATIETETMKDKYQKQAAPKQPQEEPKFKGTSTSEKQKDPIWTTQGMDMDNLDPNTRLTEEPYEESNDTQIMEEETTTIDIGELDIPGLEQTCNTNNFENIPKKQLENLEEVLNRVQRKKPLGIQTGSRWDGKFITINIKKRGRKQTSREQSGLERC